MQKLKVYLFNLLILFLIALGICSSSYSHSLALVNSKQPSTPDYFLVHNTNGSIRGAFYSLFPFSQIYVGSLHVLAGSQFFDVRNEEYFFYIFNLPESGKSKGQLDYIDIVIMVDKRRYPTGIEDWIVKSRLASISQPQIRSNSTAQFTKVLRPIDSYLKYFEIISTTGEIGSDQTDNLFLTIERVSNSISNGSSGAVLFSKSQLGLESFELLSRDSVGLPLGILKCRVQDTGELFWPSTENLGIETYPFTKDTYKIQSFLFLSNPNLIIERIHNVVPSSPIDPHCIDHNGRGQGGM